ncbi:hypothetical protein JCM8097_004938 [Rhodosporidiobolus ruineniae]
MPRKRSQNNASPDDTLTTTSASSTQPAPSTATASTSRKRKSVAFDDSHDTPAADPSEPALRRPGADHRLACSPHAMNSSRRTSTASSTATSTTPTTQPSAKALGKRRAVSPDSTTADSPSAPAASSSSSTSTTSKRRKLAHSSSATTPTAADKDYNLRTRPSRSSASATSSAKGKKTRSSTSKKPSITPSSSSSATMPRKGTRAGRAAKAKARALEDEEDALFEAQHASRFGADFDGDEGDEEGEWQVQGKHDDEEDEDVEMKEAVGGSKAGSTRGKKSSSGASSVASSSKKKGRAAEEPTKEELEVAAAGSSTSAAAAKPAYEVEEEEEDDDDDMSDDSDEDDQHVYDEDDEEIDEYETSLGLHGEERGDYGTDDDEAALNAAPRTFDANGDPLSSSSQAALDEADAALFGALAGAAGHAGGGGGGALNAFRALHGMMSGMSSRLKGLLASLRATDGDATAKLLALQELAELLSISTEDTLAGYFQIDAFAKELVAIVRGDSNGMGGGAGGDGGGMTKEEAIAFGLDPDEVMGGGGDTEENDVQMMLLACRCLANLMEALPGSAHSVVYAGAVPVLCDKLKDIQYIDLAEQTLSTLEKISEEVPSSIVREGGLSALLTYLDFFSFHVQRTAVTAAANCCRSLTLDSFPLVLEAIPTFKNTLGFADQRVVEQGCLAVVRIVDSYRHYPDKLEQLLSADLLRAVKALLNPDSTTVGPSTYTQSLKMLTTAARASPAVAINLVELNIAATLYHLLTGVAPPEWKSDEGRQVLERETTAEDDLLVMQNLVQRPKEQVQETLSLVCELLPPLPKDGIFDCRAFVPGKESRSSRSSSSKVKKEDGVELISIKREETAEAPAPVASTSTAAASSAELATAVKAEDRSDDVAPLPSPARELLVAPALGRVGSSSSSRSKKSSRSAEKDALLTKRLELVAADAPDSRKLVVKRYFALLLPTLIDVYSASVSPQVRTKAVLGLLKMVQYCDETALAEILNNVPFAAFISAILSARDRQSLPLVQNALQLVELLLVKMHDAYSYTFRREGVMHEISRLADAELVTPSSSSKSKRGSPTRTPVESESLLGASSSFASTSTALGAVTGSASGALTPTEQQLQDSITLRARHLRDQYGAADSEPALRAQGVLGRISELVRTLSEVAHRDEQGAKAAAGMEKDARAALGEIASLLADEKNPLSSFEMVESGLIEGLLSFATEQGTGPLSPQKRQEILAQAFMPQLQPGGGEATPAFAVLVKRLQESLSRMEEFEVTVAAQNQNDTDSRRNGTTMLARQLKLRLIAEDGTDVPRSCTNIVVSIHAIATFQAFNDYLRPRILAAQQSERLLGGSGSGIGSGAGDGTLSSLLAAFAAAAGGHPDPDLEDEDEEEDDDDADEPVAAPPPRRRSSRSSRTELASSGAAASTSAGGSASKGATPKSGSPKRRRSSRLSGKGLEEPAPEAEDDAMEDDEEEAPPPRASLADNLALRDDPLFAGTLDPAAPKDERMVQLEVEEGSDAKVVAKTPDGTRVATPTPATGAPKADPPASSSSSRPSPAPTPKTRSSYAAALKAEPTDFHLEFSVGGKDVGIDTTVFGAVHRHESEQPAHLRRNMWYSIYDVRFRKVAGAARPDEEDDANALGDRARREGSLFSNMPASIPTDSQQGKILQLLHVLRRVSSDYGEVEGGKTVGLADTAFVNSKLTAKLNRQLEEPMIVASACLPDWAVDLAQSFPFLFPFDTRYTFLQSTSFGYARLMQKWIGQTRSDTSRRDENLGFLARLPRQKVRISRERILESAFKVFELYGSSRSSLEVEFFSEVGSGLGPTLEFYALVSKEFARKNLGLWRHGDVSDPSDYVHNRMGLFPQPLDDLTGESSKKALKVFRVLGQFVAKAMMDSRIIDVSFARAFMRLVLEQDLPLSIASVKMVDPELGKSLEHLQEYVEAKQAIEADETKSDEERKKAIESIEVRGATVADLTLDFTLPGYDIELKEGGKDLSVDIDSLEEYIALVIDWTLGRGVESQVTEFKKGFSTVFPVRDLKTFTPAELVMLTAAIEEDWSVEALTNTTKADHGFTMDSRTVRDFISVMAELTLQERREFLSFMTGSPRLPIGGFAALSPPLTIVRKDGGDKMLPSVMTCVNFVKLPDYTSRDIVKERILMAVREGAGGFHLSTSRSFPSLSSSLRFRRP